MRRPVRAFRPALEGPPSLESRSLLSALGPAGPTEVGPPLAQQAQPRPDPADSFPLLGTFSGRAEPAQVDGSDYALTLSGSGRADGIGRARLEGLVNRLTVIPPSEPVVTALITLSTSRGSLTIKAGKHTEGFATNPQPDAYRAGAEDRYLYEIVEGTGRFAGAAGTGVMELTVLPIDTGVEPRSFQVSFRSDSDPRPEELPLVPTGRMNGAIAPYLGRSRKARGNILSFGGLGRLEGIGPVTVFGSLGYVPADGPDADREAVAEGLALIVTPRGTLNVFLYSLMPATDESPTVVHQYSYFIGEGTGDYAGASGNGRAVLSLSPPVDRDSPLPGRRRFYLSFLAPVT